MANSVERRFPLRLCTVVSPSGASLKPFVRCPRRESSIDAQDCAGCLRMRSIEWDPSAGGEVGCVAGIEAPDADDRADFGQRAARMRMHEIGTRVMTLVTRDTALGELRDLFQESGEPALGVVDGEGRIEGLVTESAVSGAPAEGTVRDVMERSVYSLPEDAPVSLALSLFTTEKPPAALITRPDGVVTGICFADDLVRWVATQLR